MRRCYVCKRQEFEANHDTKCSYYWGLLCSGGSIQVDGEWCFVEDTDGCPLSIVGATLDCAGCVECDIEA